jgi:hypothetical protein
VSRRTLHEACVDCYVGWVGPVNLEWLTGAAAAALADAAALVAAVPGSRVRGKALVEPWGREMMRVVVEVEVPPGTVARDIRAVEGR